MKTSRAVILKGFADFIGRAAGLITFPIMAHFAGPAGYGAWGQVNTIIGFVVPFASLGLGNSMVRFFSATAWNRLARRRLLQALVLVLAASGFAALAIALYSSELNELFLDWGQGAELFFWSAPLVIAGALEQILLEFLRSREWLYKLSFLSILQTAVVVIAVALLLPNGYGVVALMQALAAIKFLVVAIIGISLWSWKRPSRDTPDEPLNQLASLGSMVKFGIPLVIAGLGIWIMNFGDRLIIGYFMNPEALGRYAAVFSWSSILLVIGTPLLLPLYPRLVKHFDSGDIYEFQREASMFHRYGALLLVPGAVFLASVMQPLLVIMGGVEFKVSLFVILAMVLSIFVSQWNSIAHYMVLCADQVKFSRNAWIAAGLINLAGNIVAVPLFGLYGAAFMTLATFAGLEAAFYLKAGKRFPIAEYYRWDVTWRALGGSLAAAFAGLGWLAVFGASVLNIIVFALIFGVIYTGVMILMRELNRGDWDIIVGALPGRWTSKFRAQR